MSLLTRGCKSDGSCREERWIPPAVLSPPIHCSWAGAARQLSVPATSDRCLLSLSLGGSAICITFWLDLMRAKKSATGKRLICALLVFLRGDSALCWTHLTKWRRARGVSVGCEYKQKETERIGKKEMSLFLVCASFSWDAHFNLFSPFGCYLIRDWLIYLAIYNTVWGCGEVKHDVFDRVGSLSMQRWRHMSWVSETK